MTFRLLITLCIAILSLSFFPAETRAQVSLDKVFSEAAANSIETSAFKDAGMHFSMQVPTSWESTQVASPYIYHGKILKGAANVSVVAEEVGSEMTAKDYAKLIQEFVSKDVRLKVSELSDDEISVNGKKALRRKQTVAVTGTIVKQVIVVFIESSKAYTFTASVEESGMNAFAPVFQKMIDSVRFDDPSSGPNSAAVPSLGAI